MNSLRPPSMFRLALLLLLLCGAHTLRAQAQPVDLSNPAKPWQQVFNALGGHPRIEADFFERRYFAFRRQPRRLEGRMVYNQDRGFALDYTSPVRYTVFVRPQGVRVVRDSGGADDIPQDAASAATLRVMPLLMRFAAEKLADDFAANGEIDPQGNWSLVLKPKVVGSLPGIQEVRMEGHSGTLRRLVLVRAANERSDIEILSARFPSADAPEPLDWPQDEPAGNAQQP